MSINLILALNFIQGASSRAANLVLVLYAVDVGAPHFVIGCLAATFSLFPALLAVQAGKLADRFGALGLLVFGTTVATLGMALPYAWAGLPAIFIAAASIGLQSVSFNVCLQSLVGLLSTADNRARNYSNYSLSGSAANLVGPLIAGCSIDHAGHAAACLYLALFTLAPLLMLARYGKSLRGAHHVEKRAPGGVRVMLADREVRKTLISSSLLNAGNNLFQFYFPVYARGIGLSASAIGLILAINCAAEFIVRIVLPRLIARFREPRVLTGAFYVSAASLLLIPLIGNPVILAVIAFVFGLGVGCCGPIVTMLMFVNSPRGRSGEGIGLKITTNHLTKMVSPVLFGVLGSTFGLSPMFWVNALMLSTGGLLYRSGKQAPPRAS